MAEADDGTYAIKLLDRLEDPAPADRRRFDRVVTRVGEIDHPNVMPILDHGETVAGGRRVLWMTMPYYAGSLSLEKHLAKLGQPPDVRWAWEVVRMLASGLGALHAHDVIHRDFKPHNALLLPDGRAVVIDFDVACLTDYDRSTTPGREMGTVAYMAPEQHDGECGIGSDLFALGVVAYQLLTGRHPFLLPGMSREHFVAAVRQVDPAPPSRVRAGISATQDRLVMRLLDKVAWRRGEAIEERGAAVVLSRRSCHPRDEQPQVAISAQTRSEVEVAAAAALHGLPPTCVTVSATRSAALAAARERLLGYGIGLAVEPAVARLVQPGWERQAALARLSYAPRVGTTYDTSLLGDVETLREIAMEVHIQEHLQGADILVAPWIAGKGPVDERMAIDLRLLDAALRARDRSPVAARLPLVATVALPLAGIAADFGGAVRIANALAGHAFDGVRLALGGLGSETAPSSIAAAVAFALLLQDSGRPVWPLVTGPLRLIFWAAGVAGVESVPGRRDRFVLPAPVPEGSRPRMPLPRMELGSLCAVFPGDDAGVLLASDAIPESGCACPGCVGRDVSDRVADPLLHNVYGDLVDAARLGGLHPVQRLEIVRTQLRAAVSLGARLKLAGLLPAAPELPRHLLACLEELEAQHIIEVPRRSVGSATA